VRTSAGSEIRLGETHVGRVRRGEPHKAARLRLNDHRGDRQAIGVREQIERVAIEVNDRHAERLDGRLAASVRRIDKGPGLHADRQNGAGAEQLELQAVAQHAPAFTLLVVAVVTIALQEDRMAA
jgi:hypothetical protein